MQRLSDYLFLFFLFLIPFQTVYFLREPMIGGEKWQYGTIGIYASSLVLVAAIATGAVSKVKTMKSGSIGIGMDALWKERKTDAFLLLFVSWSGLSIFWSRDAILAGYTFLKVLLAAGAFFMVRGMVRRGKTGKILDTIVLAAAMQAIIGTGQFLVQESFSSTLFGMSAHEAWQAGTSVLKNDTGRFLRAYGTFPHPNPYGLFLAVGLLAAAYRVMIAKTAKGSMIVAGIPIILLGLVLSFSRLAWAGFGLGFAFLAIRTLIGGGKRVRMRLYATISALVLSGAVFSLMLHETVFPRFDTVTVDREGSVADRMTTYRDAFGTVRDHPFLGVGAGNSTAELMRIRPDRPVWDMQPAHDVPLLIFSELGISGLVLALLFLGSLIFDRIKKNSATVSVSALLIVLPGFLLDHFLWDSVFGLPFLFVLLGILAGTESDT